MSYWRLEYLVVFVLAIWQVTGEDILMPNETWETGYIPVRGANNELFYYLIKSRDRSESAPLVVWLSGGPGCSSTVGIFEENGPYMVHPTKLNYFRNEYTWNTFADMLFVDQPVDTGFSLAVDNSSLCNNVTCVARDFYTFFVKFLEHYPQYEKRPFYITGESYAGHYIPAIAAHILRAHNPLINLKGLAIGDPLTSLEAQLGPYADFLLDTGNLTGLAYMWGKLSILLCRVAYYSKLPTAFLNRYCDMLLAGAVTLPNYYDIRINYTYDEMDKVVVKKLIDPPVLKLLGTRKTQLQICDNNVGDHFIDDIPQSLSPELEYILEEKLDLLLYFGDKDYICNWRGGEALAKSLQWFGRDGFLKSQIKEWKAGDQPGGWYRKYAVLNFMVIYNAGHQLPMDQGKVALHMLQDFITGKFSS